MATDFFRQQDLARRNTRILVILFTLAVLSLIALTNLLVLISLTFFQTQPSVQLDWEMIALIGLVVIAVVGLAIMAKWQKLKLGGKTVAVALGGERLTADEQDPQKRQLLNVVEEMALAANLPVPPVYLLPELGINAFAAGYSPADAVVGITQGCLNQLSRDELQGVIAHEFSHILNGDMRMNIRLIAILNGILFIGHIGYYLMRASSGTRHRSNRNNNNAAGGILLVGVGLIAIGYLGSFFGNLIKAAVSRQREYLADASAVQFSRNPSGIAGALKRIGGYKPGSRIKHSNADEVSHLFFGEALSRWAAIFATHPPLEKRIKRIEPNWNGRFISPVQEPTPATAASSKASAQEQRRRAMLATLPVFLTQSAHQPQPAQAIVCALLLDDENFNQQIQAIKAYGGNALLQETDQLSATVQRLPLQAQVQLLQMTVPALKQLSASEFQQFDQLLQKLAGSVQGLRQWLCLSFIEHVVASEFDPRQIVYRVQSQTLTDLQPYLLPLLSAVADCAGSPTAITEAWQSALTQLELPADHPKPVVVFHELQPMLRPILQATPTLKRQIWQAILAAVSADKHYNDHERGLLNLLALLLEMPIPHTEDFA